MSREIFVVEDAHVTVTRLDRTTEGIHRRSVPDVVDASFRHSTESTAFLLKACDLPQNPVELSSRKETSESQLIADAGFRHLETGGRLANAFDEQKAMKRPPVLLR